MTATALSLALALMDNATAPADDCRDMDDADRADIDASLDGNGQAYARMIRRHQHQIARRMRRFTRDRATLEELVHDVFVEAYFALPRYRGDAPLSHWLTRIATRIGYRHWKRAARKSIFSPLSGSEIAPPRATPDDELDHVLNRLGPRDRLVVVLLYVEQRSVAEVAQLVGWSQTMVKVQAFRARRKLRQLMMSRRG